MPKNIPTEMYISKNAIAENPEHLTAAKRAFIVTGKHGAKASGALSDVTAVLDGAGIPYSVFDGVTENPSVESAYRAGNEARAFGADTVIGSGGARLSGGQAQRLALARTLAHPRPLLILDDPFSALDRQTEDKVFANLKAYARDKVVILISHRLYHFPEMKQIVFMEDGKTTVGTHETLCASVPAYRSLYESQTGGVDHEA